MTRMPSSRETMAAGTSPPRVMQTRPWNGPEAGQPPGKRASIAVELVPGDGKGFGLGL